MSIPSKVTTKSWIYAMSPKGFTSGLNVGKWMLFYDKSILDEKWAAVKQLIQEDQLGGIAKCSTAMENPNAISSKTGVIIVYTSDYQNQEEVYNVAKVLYDKMDYKRTMYYKTDQQTLAGTYRKYGSKKNHIYRYPLE